MSNETKPISTDTQKSIKLLIKMKMNRPWDFVHLLDPFDWKRNVCSYINNSLIIRYAASEIT